MGEVERRLADRGLTLPAAPRVPPGVTIPFRWVVVRGRRACLSGHGALTPDGAPAAPFGRVPAAVSLEDAQASARAAVLAMLASLRREIGDLDRVGGWLTVSAFVNAEPGYPWTTLVVNPASELLVELFGPDAGAHARTAPGVVALPFDLPVVIAGEVELVA